MDSQSETAVSGHVSTQECEIRQLYVKRLNNDERTGRKEQNSNEIIQYFGKITS